MSGFEMLRWALDVLAWFAIVLAPSVGAVRRRVLTTQTRINVVFGIGSGVLGVDAWDVAHRLVAGQGVLAYGYLVAVPAVLFGVLLLLVRTGRWRPRPPRTPVRAKSRAVTFP